MNPVDAFLIQLTVVCAVIMLLVAVWQRSTSTDRAPIVPHRVPSKLEVQQRAQLDAELAERARRQSDDHRSVS